MVLVWLCVHGTLCFACKGLLIYCLGNGTCYALFIAYFFKVFLSYLSMDYVVFNMLAMTAREVKDILLSYDIVCAWSVNFFNRLDNIYGDIYKLPDDACLTFVIPKFHLEAHGEHCKCAFNLNHTYGAGWTCGEGIEANWADLNLIALSICEMSLTHWHKVINDFLQAINYRKTKSLCMLSVIFSKSIH